MIKNGYGEDAFVSGIGCGAWIPSPHFNGDTLIPFMEGHWPFAQGLNSTTRISAVMVISGDGDLSSIGGNHLIHAARRNMTSKSSVPTIDLWE